MSAMEMFHLFFWIPLLDTEKTNKKKMLHQCATLESVQ